MTLASFIVSKQSNVSAKDHVIVKVQVRRGNSKQSNVFAKDQVVKIQVRRGNRSQDTGKTVSPNKLIMLLASTKMANITIAGRSNWTQNKRGEKEKGFSFGKGVIHVLAKDGHLQKEESSTAARSGKKMGALLHSFLGGRRPETS